MPLDVQIVLSPKRLRQFPGLAEEAIQNALMKTVLQAYEVAATETPVGDPSNYGYSGGRSPGQLSGSFSAGMNPRSIQMRWTAIWLGTDYAPIVETGQRTRRTFPARNYAAATKTRVFELLLRNLASEFQAIGG